MYLTELVTELKSHKDIVLDDMILHMLHDPRYFNITSLTKNVKDRVAKKISKIGKKTGFWQKQGQGVINHMYRDDTTDALDQFFVESRIMDKYRKQRIENVMPELYNMIKSYDPLNYSEGKILKAAEKLDNAYIVNLYENDVKDSNELQYTQIQILSEKEGGTKIPIEEIKLPPWKNLIKILKRD